MNIRVSETPNYPPNLCAYCGTCRSELFVDLGINLEVHFNPVIYNGLGFDGAVILCAACWDNLQRVGNQQVAAFKEAHGPNIELDRSVAEDSGTPEQHDSEPASSDPEPDPTGLDEDVEEFATFFGKRG